MDEWEKYELHHRKRLAIKPGLTGMWQVSGRSDITDFEEVVELDTKYIAEWCLKEKTMFVINLISVGIAVGMFSISAYVINDENTYDASMEKEVVIAVS